MASSKKDSLFRDEDLGKTLNRTLSKNDSNKRRFHNFIFIYASTRGLVNLHAKCWMLVSTGKMSCVQGGCHWLGILGWHLLLCPNSSVPHALWDGPSQDSVCSKLSHLQMIDYLIPTRRSV